MTALYILLVSFWIEKEVIETDGETWYYYEEHFGEIPFTSEKDCNKVASILYQDFPSSKTYCEKSGRLAIPNPDIKGHWVLIPKVEDHL